MTCQQITTSNGFCHWKRMAAFFQIESQLSCKDISHVMCNEMRISSQNKEKWLSNEDHAFSCLWRKKALWKAKRLRFARKPINTREDEKHVAFRSRADQASSIRSTFATRTHPHFPCVFSHHNQPCSSNSVWNSSPTSTGNSMAS